MTISLQSALPYLPYLIIAFPIPLLFRRFKVHVEKIDATARGFKLLVGKMMVSIG